MPKMDQNQANDQLRHALNELRAIGTADERRTDREQCAIRLRSIASHIESDGDFPTIETIIEEAHTLPIQG